MYSLLMVTTLLVFLLQSTDRAWRTRYVLMQRVGKQERARRPLSLYAVLVKPFVILLGMAIAEPSTDGYF